MSTSQKLKRGVFCSTLNFRITFEAFFKCELLFINEFFHFIFLIFLRGGGMEEWTCHLLDFQASSQTIESDGSAARMLSLISDGQIGVAFCNEAAHIPTDITAPR